MARKSGSGTSNPRPVSDDGDLMKDASEKTPPRTILVLACKFAKLQTKTKDQLQRLDPDLLRLDTLQEQVVVRVKETWRFMGVWG